MDKDDSDDKGYQHACRLLQQAIPNIDNDLLKPRYDIWSFGLYIYQIKFPEPVSCNLLDLIPHKINNEENRPFWFLFKQPPTFKDPIIRNHILKESESRRGKLVDRAIYADLSYGALTSMNRFFVHKDHIIRKKTKWTIRFQDEFFEIQSNEFQRLKDDTISILTQKKYKVPVDIIDRAATIYLWNDGFCLFLNMKGNIHELLSRTKTKNQMNMDMILNHLYVKEYVIINQYLYFQQFVYVFDLKMMKHSLDNLNVKERY